MRGRAVGVALRGAGLVAALTACSAPPARSTGKSAGPPPNAEFDERMFDRTADPCDDFYQFACGGWIAVTRLPPGRGSMARYELIGEGNEQALRRIVAESSRAPASADQRRIGDYQTACLAASEHADEDRAALAAELAAIDRVSDPRSLAVAVARLHLLGGGIGPWWTGRGALFGFGTDYAFDDGSLVDAQLDQGGLGLPGPSSYLDQSREGAALRERYQAHVAAMLGLAGATTAEARDQAAAVVALEVMLARSSASDADRRDPKKAHHPIGRAELARLVPSFDWQAYLTALGRPDLDRLNLMVPGFYRALEATLARTPPAALRPYLRWHLVHALGPALPEPFAAEDKHYQGLVTGSSESPPRGDLCLREVSSLLGWSLAAEFVARRFPPATRRSVDVLVDGVVASLAERFDTASWLDPVTRRAAHEKLRRLGRKVGAPATGRSYDGLTLSRTGYLANRIAATAFESSHWVRRAGTRPERGEWLMTPQTLNAYYDLARNEMVFPAAIFQPPLFFTEGRAANNFGNVGWVLAHELSHGFDSSGREFDTSGAARNWWSAAARATYDRQAACVVRQYDAFEALPGLHLDGSRTLTENVADLGASRLAYRAYRAARRGQPPGPPVAGFDEHQQFFVAFAHASCEKTSQEALRTTVQSDTHAPWRFRVNGSLANLPEFARAFHCQAGSRMAPRTRCQVW